jgi:hypothetical protein
MPDEVVKHRRFDRHGSRHQIVEATHAQQQGQSQTLNRHPAGADGAELRKPMKHRSVIRDS